MPVAAVAPRPRWCWSPAAPLGAGAASHARAGVQGCSLGVSHCPLASIHRATSAPDEPQ